MRAQAPAASINSDVTQPTDESMFYFSGMEHTVRITHTYNIP